MQKYLSRVARVGEGEVRRSLPRREHRTVGAWCFLDHFGPSSPGEAAGLSVGPHPHCGLSTVTWLIEGSAVHTDSLGTEQPLRPGQLNLMTAGHGISHAERTPTEDRGPLHGVQFWIAQPEATRHGAPAFEHHAALPVVGLGPLRATVLLGAFGGVRSPARADTALVGVELLAGSEGANEVGVDPGFEHAVVVLEGRVRLSGTTLEVGEMAHLPVGTAAVAFDTAGPARWLLIGGEPFEAPVQMWWNFVGRHRAEMDDAVREWNSSGDRFGEVRSEMDRIRAPEPPWWS